MTVERQPQLRRASLLVLVGSAGGFLVTLALTPVVTRIYLPSLYGSFAAITALVSVFVGVSTLRLEVLSQREGDDDQASGLLRLGMLASVLWGSLITAVAAAVVAVRGVSMWWMASGALVVFGSFQLVGTAFYTRVRDYRSLASANFAQSAGLGVVQAIFGLASASLGSLMAGFVLPRLVWLRPIRRGTARAGGGQHSIWLNSRRYAALSGSSALINSAAGQVPILFTSALYGQASTGLLAMAVRILVSPLGLIGQAVAAAATGEVGAALRDADNERAHAIVRRGMRDQTLVGALPCGLAIVCAPLLANRILGPSWTDVGQFVAALSLGALGQFAVAPFAQLLNISGHSRWLLQWDVLRLLLIVVSLAIPWIAGGDVLSAMWCYSGALVVTYFILAAILLRALSQQPNHG